MFTKLYFFYLFTRRVTPIFSEAISNCLHTPIQNYPGSLILDALLICFVPFETAIGRVQGCMIHIQLFSHIIILLLTFLGLFY